MSLNLFLDPAVVSSALLDSGSVPTVGIRTGFGVSAADAQLLDA
ncbi:hypothetical protein [Pelagibacterium halotolerans]